jgi:hypothetical protein
VWEVQSVTSVTEWRSLPFLNFMKVNKILNLFKQYLYPIIRGHVMEQRYPKALQNENP